MASGYSWSSKPSSTIYYAASGRLTQSSNVRPSLDCSNSSDILKIPVGLITADEVVYGGLAWNATTTNNYFYTGQAYWTMSPFNTSSPGDVGVFDVYSAGGFSYGIVHATTIGVRPVINLKANTKFEGSGTASDPYTVVS